MSYLIVEQWDAIEIFCRVICRVDKKLEMKDFQNNEVLSRELLKYSKKEAPAKVSGKIFGKKTNAKGLPVSKRPKSFYELGRKIRNSLPVEFEKEEFEGYLNFIKLSDSSFPTQKSIEWHPSQRQRKLEGTKWLLYYYHQDADENKPKSTTLVSGIARAILSLNPFAKAEVEGFKESENYTGKFAMYGKDETFIRLEMKLKDYKVKDLNMLIYIGIGKVELALGQFHNLGRSIYSGTVIIEPLLEKKGSEIKGRFFKESELKELPAYIRSYFKEKRKNILRVPCKITNRVDFLEWLENKNSLLE